MFGQIVPERFYDFILHRDISIKLEKYTKENIQNMLFYGPRGSGKKTLLYAFIRHLYGDITSSIKEYSIKINNNEVTINTIQSCYHYEINLYEYGLYDKHVLCDFIKDIASTRNISNNSHKLIILNNIDRINKYAQLALRRLMEQLHETARFFVNTSRINNIDKALISRFCCLRIPFPSNSLDLYLNKTEKSLNKKLNFKKIKKKCNSHLFKLNLLIHNIDYIDPINIFTKFIDDILENANDILFIEQIRDIIYRMHLLDVKPADLINKYVDLIMSSYKYSLEDISSILNEAALNEERCNITNKYFFCLEKFFIFIKKIKEKNK